MAIFIKRILFNELSNEWANPLTYWFTFTHFLFCQGHGSFPISSDFIILLVTLLKKWLYSFLNSFISHTTWKPLKYLNKWLEFENNTCIYHNRFIFNFPTLSLRNIMPSFFPWCSTPVITYEPGICKISFPCSAEYDTSAFASRSIVINLLKFQRTLIYPFIFIVH